MRAGRRGHHKDDTTSDQLLGQYAGSTIVSPSARASKSSGYRSPHTARQFGEVILDGDPVLAVVIQLTCQEAAVWGRVHAVRHVGIRRRSYWLDRAQVLKLPYVVPFETCQYSAGLAGFDAPMMRWTPLHVHACEVL